MYNTLYGTYKRDTTADFLFFLSKVEDKKKEETDRLSRTNTVYSSSTDACILQCGRYYNEVTGSISSIERLRGRRGKALIYVTIKPCPIN